MPRCIAKQASDSDDTSCMGRTHQMTDPLHTTAGAAASCCSCRCSACLDRTIYSHCRGANITLFSPLQRVNQYPTQFFRVDFHGLTAEKNPLYLFNLTGAKQ